MRYRKITNTRNLASTLMRLGSGNQGVLEKPAEVREPWDRKKFLNRLSAVVLFLMAICIVVLVYSTIKQKEDLRKYNSLKDSRLVMHEAYLHDVKKVTYLFSIKDAESYANARATVPLSDELMQQYFPTGQYMGTPSTAEIEVTIQDIRYELNDKDSIGYLIYLDRVEAGRTIQYLVAVELYNNKIAQIQILN